MAYSVSNKQKNAIDFAPATVAEEVLQNVRTIITTVQGSVPLDRAFGIDGEVVDLPINVAKAKLTNEIFRAIRRYEPRVEVTKIAFSGEETGRLLPEVTVEIKAGGE